MGVSFREGHLQAVVRGSRRSCLGIGQTQCPACTIPRRYRSSAVVSGRPIFSEPSSIVDNLIGIGNAVQPGAVIGDVADLKYRICFRIAAARSDSSWRHMASSDVDQRRKCRTGYRCRKSPNWCPPGKSTCLDIRQSIWDASDGNLQERSDFPVPGTKFRSLLLPPVGRPLGFRLRPPPLNMKVRTEGCSKMIPPPARTTRFRVAEDIPRNSKAR